MVKNITTMILELYLNAYDKIYYLREMAELLKKPHQTLKPYLIELTQVKILLETKKKNITEYKLNLKEPLLIEYITLTEKQVLISRLLQDMLLKTLYERLVPMFQVSTFIVFGSTVQKTQKTSNIDLFVIGKKPTLTEFETIYNKKVHLIHVSQVQNANPAFIREIYKNHLILNDHEKVVRYLVSQHEQNKLV